MNIVIDLKLILLKLKISIGWTWIRFFIVLSAILLSTIAAYWGSSQLQILLIASSIGAVGFILLLKEPNLGFLFALVGGIFFHYDGPGGLNFMVIMVGVMLVLWILEMLVVRREFEFINSRALLPIVVFIVISLLAFGMGQIPWFVFASQAPMDAQLGGLAIFVMSAGMLLLAAHRFREERWLRIFLWVFMGLGAIYVVGRVMGLTHIDRLYNRGFSAGSMFWTWLVAMTLSQAVFNTKLKTYVRLLLAALVMITFYVALVKAFGWKSGWLPPLLCAVIIIGLRFKKLLIVSIPIGLVTSGIFIAALISTDEYSWGTRVDAWLIVLEISKLNPFLGLGFSNYYWYTPLYPIRGWSVSFNSHSQYVDLIAQAGIIGLVCFLWIFAELIRLNLQLLNRLPEGFPRSYSYGTLAGLGGTLLAAFLVDWVLPFVYNIGLPGFRASILPWIFLGGLIALNQLYTKKNSDATTERGVWLKS